MMKRIVVRFEEISYYTLQVPLEKNNIFLRMLPPIMLGLDVTSIKAWVTLK